MEQTVMEMIRDMLKVDAKDLESRMDDEEIWDSLQWIETVFYLEEELKIKFEEDEFPEIKTPRRLCEAAIGKVKASEKS